MKALSIKQPFAALILDSSKTLEVRSWPTDHRGELLICASATPKNVFWKDGENNRQLHSGCMIAIVEVVGCRRMTKADVEASLSEYDPRAYVWELEAIAGVRPDKVIGKLGLFEVPDSKIIRLNPDPTVDWMFNYPCPQGTIEYKKGLPLLE